MFKHPGGKRRLAATIAARLPARITRFSEPFCGGAAVFAHLHDTGRLEDAKSVVLRDTNAGIVDLLRQVREDSRALLDDVADLRAAYRRRPEALFYEQRDLWNRGHRDPCRFLFLKQASFNGLWRENADGHHNAPWGKNPGIKFADEANVHAWHQALQDVDVSLGSALDYHPVPGEVVYLDPPYVDTFNGYTAEGFGEEAQVRLLQLASEWRGTVVYSNSLAALPLVQAHWPEAHWTHVETSYVINSDGEGREVQDEVLCWTPSGAQRNQPGLL